MRTWIFLCLFLCLFLQAFAVPNFIIIIADDLGYNDLGVYGSPTISTPNLDQMAREGMKFTQFYNAGPLCTPSRGAMLTGRLPIRSGLYTYLNYPYDMEFRVFYPSSVGCLPPSERILPEYLRDSGSGYANVMIGKWHLGHNPRIGCLPSTRGFDYFYGLPYSHEEGYPGPAPEDLIWPPLPLFQNEEIVQQPANMSDLTPRYTQKALNFIDQFAQSKQPFFMHVAYEEPHIPLFASPQFINTSLRGLYGDAVQEMDDSIGQILNKLRSTGLASNTLVLFSSDNGAWINPGDGLPNSPVKPFDGGSNAPFYDGKGSTWEGGVRAPGIAWWPGMIQPTITPSVVSMMDFLPTFLDFAGVSQPSVELDGTSITSILLGKNMTSPHTFMYYWREHMLYAVRYGPYKAHYYTRSGFENDPPVYHDPPLLFQLEWDPAELHPLNDTDYQDILNTINIAYNQHLAEVEPGVSQYEAQDWTLVPCCHGAFNSTEFLEYIREHEWTLALWEELGCVCAEEITTTSAVKN